MTRTRRLALALAGVFAVVALGTACGDDGGSNEDFSDVDAEDLLARSADRMEEVETFHFEVAHENGTTEIINGLSMVSAAGDIQGMERMRLEVEARFASTNIETGIVILPGEDYLQNPITGRWEEQDEIDVSDLFDPASGVTGLMRNTSNVEVIDREDVDGVDSYVVETQVDSANLDAFVSNAEAGNAITARVWIGVEDLLVRRIEARGALAPNDSEDIVRRLSLSQFDEPIEITAP